MGGDAFGSISGNTSTITASTSSSETYRQENQLKPYLSNLSGMNIG